MPSMCQNDEESKNSQTPCHYFETERGIEAVNDAKQPSLEAKQFAKEVIAERNLWLEDRERLALAVDAFVERRIGSARRDALEQASELCHQAAINYIQERVGTALHRHEPEDVCDELAAELRALKEAPVTLTGR